MAAPDGLLIVDKPSGWTSHDVVARCRRLAATRKVGHAGTLDPMATGVLVVGIGRATRLLGHLSLTTKGYDATIRLGQSTVSDDADGELVETTDASHLTSGEIISVLADFGGDITQVPSSVSAVKIQGERAYKRVRAGEEVDLPARQVHVSSLVARQVRRGGAFVDVDVMVECSSGTYIRALARDVGASLGVGGHLTALRRTRVGVHTSREALTLDQLARYRPDDMPVVAIDVAARGHFGWYVIEEEQVEAVRNGRSLTVRLSRTRPDEAAVLDVGADGPVAVLAPDGEFLALYRQHGVVAKAVAVFAGS
ncbi:MAG: tRNA pseudouridine(55) synthase TruB [Propionibacteriales bacterium]|nr:tRNA pseudouridine(55) synthase TruB [Propionibacteriales bacterium]